MKRSFGKELLYQLFVATATVVTFPILMALFMNERFVESYLFALVFSAPVFYTGGVLFSTIIEWMKARLTGIQPNSAASYVLSVAAYLLAGALVMYLYLATVLNDLQVHTSRDVYGILIIGAGAGLYMYLVSLILTYVRSKKVI